MRRADGRRPARRRGFALLVVIWGVGVISLLIVSFSSTERGRLAAAVNAVRAEQASLLAQSAIDAAILLLIGEQPSLGPAGAQRPARDGKPVFCAMAEAAAAIAIENEIGKVDLNSASAELLKRLFTGFGMGMSEADRLASAVVAFRTIPANDIQMKDRDYESAGRPFGPKRGLFQTVFEFDQVVGVEGGLSRSLTPFLTVHSQMQGVDPNASPPALFAALAGYPPAEVKGLAAASFPNALDRRDPRFPQEFKQQSGEGAVFAIHAETALAGGQNAVREAIVDLRQSGAPGQPFAIREIRRTAPRFLDALQGVFSNGVVTLPDCRDMPPLR